MTVKERIQEYKKKKDENSGEQQRDDRSVKYRISEFKLNKYDTNALQENVKKSLTSAESIFKGWVDQNTVDFAISDLQKTRQSLNDYRDLVSIAGKNIPNYEALISGLDSTMISLTLSIFARVVSISSRASIGSSYGFRKLPDANSFTDILSSFSISNLER